MKISRVDGGQMNNSAENQSFSVLGVFGGLIVVFVVLAVGAVLSGHFGRTHDYSPKSQCQNNIKEMAIAIQLYWTDYDTKLPSSALVNRSKKWNKGDFVKFATKVGRDWTTNNPQTYVEALRPYTKNQSIAFCPSDPAKDCPNQNTQASYFWKTAIDKAWYGEGCKKPCRKEGDFGYNSDQVILYERADFHTDRASFLHKAQPQPLKNGAQINVAYLDSHVKPITIKNATSGDAKNPAACDDGEPMYFNYNLEQDKGLSSDKIAAKFVDPIIYGDDF